MTKEELDKAVKPLSERAKDNAHSDIATSDKNLNQMLVTEKYKAYIKGATDTLTLLMQEVEKDAFSIHINWQDMEEVITITDLKAIVEKLK